MALLSGFHHVAFNTTKFDETVEFYTKLGLPKFMEFGEQGSRGIMLSVDGKSVVEIFEKPETEAISGGYIHVAYRTDDADAAFKAAVEAGAEVVSEPRNVDIIGKDKTLPVRIAFVNGLNGEVIEFFQIFEK